MTVSNERFVQMLQKHAKPLDYMERQYFTLGSIEVEIDRHREEEWYVSFDEKHVKKGYMHIYRHSNGADFVYDWNGTQEDFDSNLMAIIMCG
jgi:hypothetical protein